MLCTFTVQLIQYIGSLYEFMWIGFYYYDLCVVIQERYYPKGIELYLDVSYAYFHQYMLRNITRYIIYVYGRIHV